MTDKEVLGLYEAYQRVYESENSSETDLAEFENWVNELVQEGHDLSEYSWDDMYEIYVDNLQESVDKQESYDLYDYILEYLISEGYTESVEGAQVIMTNMSEEWRKEILDERNRGERDMTDSQVRERRDRRDGDTSAGGYKPYVIAGGSQKAEHERNRGKKKTKSGYGRTQWQ